MPCIDELKNMLKTANNKGTVEGVLKRWLGACSVAIMLLVGYIMVLHQADMSIIVVVLLLLSFFLFCTAKSVFQRIFESYRRVSQHLDALSCGEHTQRARSMYSGGIVANIHTQLTQLSHQFKQNKRLYNENSFIIFNLIEQLNTPILMFNQRLQLSHANGAFSDIYGLPWQAKRKCHISQLDLTKKNNKWELVKNRAGGKRWQIRQSFFKNQNDVFLLLVFVDLERTYRDAEQLSWQKLIRILSHEIRNSLTPISSLADALEQSEVMSERGHLALSVIKERSDALQSFMLRYDDISKPLELKISKFTAGSLIEKLICLFREHTITVKGEEVSFFADHILLEQVLINLIKNAIEASSTSNDTIDIDFTNRRRHVRIRVRDNGHGIVNIDDVMTPFYSTKPHGQGLGLVFCQNIVRQHGGELILSNRANQVGVTATICLPHPQV